jgi:hypothetical protein
MAVAIEGTPDATSPSGATYTVESGADRVCVWGVGSRVGSASQILQSGTFDVSMNIRESGRASVANDLSVSLLDVLEAAIPGGSNTLTATYDNTPDGTAGVALTLSGVNQASPITDSSSAGGFGVFTVPSFSVVDGGIAIIGITAQGGITGAPSGYTLLLDNVPAQTAETSVAYKLITADGTENPTWTAVGNAAVLGVSYAPAVDAAIKMVVLKRIRGF